jgi:hypothetical protein
MLFLRGEILAAFLAAAAGGGGKIPRDAQHIPKDESSRKSLPQDSAERILHDGSYQKSLPQDSAKRILEDDTYQKALPKDPVPPDIGGSHFMLSLGPLGVIANLVLWAVLALAVAVAVAWLVTRLGGRTLDAEVDPESAPALLDVPLESAQKLAAAGRFAEAIHILLLETLAALSRAAQLAPSLTSREILARVPLPPRARDALVGLVLAVEVSRFGGAPAGERDYQACLGRFHAFLETYQRRGPRAEGAAA